jgi:hypothetical protein
MTLDTGTEKLVSKRVYLGISASVASMNRREETDSTKMIVGVPVPGLGMFAPSPGRTNVRGLRVSLDVVCPCMGMRSIEMRLC